MTHEELLTKINSTGYSEPNYIITRQGWNPKLQSALRSVVELHKPVTSIEGEIWCRECTEWEFLLEAKYPCPTIQAIEKELS
jgi:hypothetical protein